jgi:hypothetical protein
MVGPEWLRWILVVAMVAATGYHLARGFRAWRSMRGPLPLTDLWHAFMGVGMALMALGLTHRDAAWWLLAFAIPTLLFAGRGLDRYVVGGLGPAAHDLRRVVVGLAMCWMLAAPMAMTMPAGSGDVGDVARPAALPGPGHGMGTMPSADPAVVAGLLGSVTVLLLVAVAALAVRSTRMMLQPGRVVVGGAPVPARRSAEPASWHGCQAAMQVATAVMLATMV